MLETTARVALMARGLHGAICLCLGFSSWFGFSVFLHVAHAGAGMFKLAFVLTH